MSIATKQLNAWIAKAAVRPPPRVALRSDGGKIISFTVPESAMGAPRQTQSDKWKQRPCVMRYRDWCDLLREGCPNPPDPETVEEVSVKSVYVPPLSWSKRKRSAAMGTRKRTKPDGDNVMKGVFDALWKRDEKLGDEAVSRWWGEHQFTEVVIRVASPAKKMVTR